MKYFAPFLKKMGLKYLKQLTEDLFFLWVILAVIAYVMCINAPTFVHVYMCSYKCKCMHKQFIAKDT